MADEFQFNARAAVLAPGPSHGSVSCKVVLAESTRQHEPTLMYAGTSSDTHVSRARQLELGGLLRVSSLGV